MGGTTLVPCNLLGAEKKELAKKNANDFFDERRLLAGRLGVLRTRTPGASASAIGVSCGGTRIRPPRRRSCGRAVGVVF